MSALSLHPGLLATSRLHRLSRTDGVVTSSEWSALIVVGVVSAAVSTLVDLHLGIPGHAILKVVLPVSAGLALVPRRGAGTVVGVSALVTALSLRFAGYGGSGLGFGALTSLTAIGPLLDFTLRRASTGRSVYIGIVLAGLEANLAALVVRGTLKGIGLEHAGGRPLSIWLSQAVVTYTLCGIAAGLVSAFIWFCSRSESSAREEEVPS